MSDAAADPNAPRPADRSGKLKDRGPLTDEGLLERVGADDAGAWNEFWQLYQPLLRDYVCRMRVRDEDADDLLSELFIKLKTKMPGFKLDHKQGQFRGWLRTVCDNFVRDWARSRQRRLQHEHAAPHDPQYSHDYFDHIADSFDPIAEAEAKRQAAFNTAFLARLLREVQQMHKRRKTWRCFELYILQDRPSDEVARLMGYGDKINNVHVSANRVIKDLRALAQRYGASIDEKGQLVDLPSMPPGPEAEDD